MPSGREPPLTDRLQVEEERLGHVAELLAGREADEVARLDPRRGVEIDLGALDGRREDRAWCAVSALP